MRTLVTGAPGWLGSRLVERLVSEGRSIRVLAEATADISELRRIGVEVVSGDLRNPETVAAAVHGSETVFHCAGVIHAKRAQDFDEINVQGTATLLNACRSAEVQRFVNISSEAAAGFNRERHVRMTEEDAPRPISLYGRSKLSAERAVHHYHETYGLQALSVRPAMFYGPGQPERRRRLMHMVQRQRAILFGDGRSLRSMTYIDNLIDGLLLAEKHATFEGEVYWLADANPYGTREVLQEMATALNTTLRVYRFPAFAARACELLDERLALLGVHWMEVHLVGESIRDLTCSIDRARQQLGYEPSVDLAEGMRRTVEWARSVKQL